MTDELSKIICQTPKIHQSRNLWYVHSRSYAYYIFQYHKKDRRDNCFYRDTQRSGNL